MVERPSFRARPKETHLFGSLPIHGLGLSLPGCLRSYGGAGFSKKSASPYLSCPGPTAPLEFPPRDPKSPNLKAGKTAHAPSVASSQRRALNHRPGRLLLHPILSRRLCELMRRFRSDLRFSMHRPYPYLANISGYAVGINVLNKHFCFRPSRPNRIALPPLCGDSRRRLPG